MTEEMSEALRRLEERVSHLEEALGRLEDRGLTAEQLEETMRAHPDVVLEVAETWTGAGGALRFLRGQELRASMWPRLADLVRAGLRLRAPSSNADIVSRLREQEEASRAAAAAAAAEARASAALSLSQGVALLERG